MAQVQTSERSAGCDAGAADPHEPAGESRTRIAPAWLGAALVLLTVVAYIPAYQAGFVWDDDANVTQNLPLRDLEGLRELWLEPGATTQYYPLVYTSLWLEHALWGLEPLGYHVDNVLLHAASALLFWRILVLFGLGAGAWFGAAIFALHPVHVESVAWVTERKNVLSGFFYLASAFIYLRSACDLFRSPGASERRIAWAASLALFVAALLSKSPTASLPAALLVVAWWRRGRLAWIDVRPVLPFFALAAPIGLLTASMEANVGEVLGFDWQPSIVERVLLGGRAVWFYASKLIAPWPLMFVYPRWSLDDAVLWQYAYPLAAVALLFVLARERERIGRAPLAVALFFGGTLLPVLGLFEIYFYRFSFVADHWVYLASLGPIALAAAGLQRLGSRARLVAGTVIVVTCVTLTAAQSRVFVDSETLWRHSLAYNPSSSMAHYNLALELQAEGRMPDAAHHYEQAIAYAPESANAYNNLAQLRESQGRRREAIVLYRAAIEAEPRYAKARWNLALALERGGQFEKARPHFERAIEDAQAASEGGDMLIASRLYLSRALLRHGEFAAAYAEVDELLDEAPQLVPAHVLRGRLLLRAGRHREAADAFGVALKIAPGNEPARSGLAKARASGAQRPPG